MSLFITNLTIREPICESFPNLRFQWILGPNVFISCAVGIK